MQCTDAVLANCNLYTSPIRCTYQDPRSEGFSSMSQRLKQNCDTADHGRSPFQEKKCFHVFSPDQTLLRLRGSSHRDLTLATCKLRSKISTHQCSGVPLGQRVVQKFKPLIAGFSQMALFEACSLSQMDSESSCSRKRACVSFPCTARLNMLASCNTKESMLNDP